MIKYFIVFIYIYLFFGCTNNKNIKKEISALFIIKMKNLKFVDQGFLYFFKREILAEIYSAGKSTFKLHIFKKKICMGNFKCIKPSIFNKKFLDKEYPNHILENIFRSNPIFKKKNIKFDNKYFVQNIKNEKFNITYSVNKDGVKFKDKLNSIKIYIKNIN